MDFFADLPVTTLAFVFVVTMCFVAGFIDSIAGGGGLIAIPATLIAGVPPHFALGTNKFMSSLGTTAACWNYARSNTVVWKVVLVGVGFSLIGSVLGAKAVLLIDQSLVGKIMLGLLPLAALTVLIPMRSCMQSTELSFKRLCIITPILCTAIGFYDGFFGPGTGTFLLMGLHFALGLSLVGASATAKPFNLASNVSAMVVFVVNGQVLYNIAIPMALANIFGNVLGSRMAIAKGSPMVRKMLLVSLGLLFATLLWKTFGE